MQFEINDTESDSSYIEFIYKEFANLLSTKGDDEKIFQVFFEKNPVFIPHFSNVFGETELNPYLWSVISKPKLNGLIHREPDFMVFAENSLVFKPILIEIEAPNKKYFNKQGITTSNFSQALNQIIEWQTILSKPENITPFYNAFNIPEILRKKKFEPIYVLIYGRRSEYENDILLSDKRSQLGKNVEIMSYDRLEVNPKRILSSFTTNVKDGKYIAKYITPTFKINKMFRHIYENVSNLENAIKSSDYLTQSRKDFIIRRIKEIIQTPPEAKTGKFNIISFKDIDLTME